MEESSAWGWIDHLITELDDERYMRKFWPRQKDILWSAANEKRIKESLLLLKKGDKLGTKWGIRATGRW